MKHPTRFGPFILGAVLLALVTWSCGGGAGSAQLHLDRAKALNEQGEELQAAVELGSTPE